MNRKLDQFDLVFLALLALLLLLVLRLVRSVFGTDEAGGDAISTRIVQDFSLAAGIYVASRLALGMGGPVGAALAGATLLVGVAGGWIRRLLAGDTGEPGGPK
jgi:hypothetical protein